MTTYLLHDGAQAISVGSVIADPLPDGLTAVALTDDQYEGLRGGWLTWDGTGLVSTGKPSPEQEAQHEANRDAIDQAITDAITRLDALIAAPAVADVPAGTLTTAQLSNVARAMRDAVQANRAGAQEVALILKRTIRLVRGDFDSTD